MLKKKILSAISGVATGALLSTVLFASPQVGPTTASSEAIEPLMAKATRFLGSPLY